MRLNYTKIVFGGIVVLLLTMSYITYRNLNNYMNEVKWVRHSNGVLRQLAVILSEIKDAETGHRGYQLTGDSSFLRPYYNTLNSIRDDRAKLDSLIDNNEIQKAYADSLNFLIHKQFNVIETILKNEKSSGRSWDQFEVGLLKLGKENMDKIRYVVGKMEDAEEAILQERLDMERDFRLLTPISGLTYMLLALGGLTFLFSRVSEELLTRKKAEKELHKLIGEIADKENRYRSLFERSVDPIFLTDENFNFIDANVSLLSLFHYSKEELLAMSLSDLFHLEKDFLFFQNTISGQGQVKSFEAVLHTNENTKLYCLINCVFIPEGGSISCCYQGIIHDLTIRRKAQRELVAAEKLAMTGKMARTIAHEVRNPLTNLSLALEQLKEENREDGLNQYTEIIARNANRIEQLISEMLSSSRPEELKLDLVPMHQIVSEVGALVKDRIDLHQMKLVMTIPDQIPRVLVDKEKIKIALLNIFINAIEAMEPGMGVLSLALEKRNGKVVLSVSDNGRGIAEEDLDKLFDPFYTAKDGGMGLGLTTSQSIFSRHNIDVDVNSQLGVGTTFYITFDLPE
ncbi:MAG TPA: CHASE3 domain-containing protein [Cyclobacteriaceae bacterium]|nr:CHASE3 domain-containing protein [Cyclobacteriaceae bacterium]